MTPNNLRLFHIVFFFCRDCLAFATEPIFASLANLLGKQANMPSPLPTELKVFI